MSNKKIEDMSADIAVAYHIVFGEKSKTSAKIRAMRKIRKTYIAIYEEQIALAELTEQSARETK
jgi:hypothetical protein